VATENVATISRLRGLVEVSRLIRAEEDLPALLAAIGRTIADCLGFATVAINLYRPAFDDVVVTSVHGSDEARQALLGDSRELSAWAPFLDDRFLRRGAYLILEGDLEWDPAVVRYVPPLERSDDDGAWQPEDALMVPLRHTDGHLLGIISVDEPASGRRPSDEELDVLVAVAEHAALAVQSAQEAAQAARHRAALEQLLAVSSNLAAASSTDVILSAVCDGIREALEFHDVAVELVDARTGRLEAHAGAAPATARSLADLERLLQPVHELEGCYLVPGEGVLVPLVSREGSVIGVIRAAEPEGRLRPSTERLQALRVFANQSTAAIVSAEHFQELRFLADHDPLTRLLNRRAFIRRLESETARARRYGRAFGLVICDLDGFKALNDRYGHPAGDAALCTFAAILTQALRRPDDAFRIGGDEFAVVLAEASDADALEVAERVSAALAASDDERLDGVGASFGVAACPAHAEDPQTLFRLADEALYRAKRSGASVRFAA
jgi:diguanylate cyclase (GGDEF)-like protein